MDFSVTTHMSLSRYVGEADVSVFYRSLALDQGRTSFVAKAFLSSDATVQFALVNGPSVHPRS
jgi:hypothetical protein